MSSKNWILVAPDQLSDQVEPLKSADPASTGVVLIESLWWAKRRSHHKQKIAFVFSNLRHFGAELRRAGFEVRHEQTARPTGVAAASVISELGNSLTMMEPANRELRLELESLVASGDIQMIPNQTWLTTREMFESSQDGPPWRMDRFYRHVRKVTGILMQDGDPVGGKYSFDDENREPWHGTPPAPDPPTFERDDIKEEVCDMVERLFDQNPGRLNRDRLPASRADAQKAWSWALEHALPHFGPYEDAMSTVSSTLFHSMISPLVNLSRILPQDALDDVMQSGIPLQSLEGFVRQLIGWREFVRHVHVATDGFRNVGGKTVSTVPDPEPSTPSGLDRGAEPNYLEGHLSLPPAYWGQPSGLNCLDTVVRDVLDEGWSHHITRLMVLSNLSTLLDASPRELTDWFWEMYIDAWDWVVEPNVLAMGTYALGDLMTTKPYVSGAAYINRMSDYCSKCAFDPKSNCPVTRLYWSFLERKRDQLSGNPRMALPLASAGRRDDRDKEIDEAVFSWATDRLAKGQKLIPAQSPTKVLVPEMSP